MAGEDFGQTSPQWWRGRSALAAQTRVVAYILLIGLSIIFMIPLLWMVSTSFKESTLIFRVPPVWIPPTVTLENYRRGWELMIPSFGRLFSNTSIITVVSLVGTLVSSSLVGFAFAVYQARGKRVLFAILLATMMIPSQVTLIPQFILFARIGWVNTWLPLIVPVMLAPAFFVFMFRQFFATIPRDLLDSAEIDGCTPLGIYWKIAVPMAKPAFATAAVFAFLGSWNDLMGPLIYLTEMDKFTLTLGLANFQAVNYTMIQYLMPMALLALVPVLILFFAAQKYYVQGIVTTGLKG